jgi:hypothetical protein
MPRQTARKSGSSLPWRVQAQVNPPVVPPVVVVPNQRAVRGRGRRGGGLGRRPVHPPLGAAYGASSTMDDQYIERERVAKWAKASFSSSDEDV